VNHSRSVLGDRTHEDYKIRIPLRSSVPCGNRARVFLHPLHVSPAPTEAGIRSRPRAILVGHFYALNLSCHPRLERGRALCCKELCAEVEHSAEIDGLKLPRTGRHGEPETMARRSRKTTNRWVALIPKGSHDRDCICRAFIVRSVQDSRRSLSTAAMNLCVEPKRIPQTKPHRLSQHTASSNGSCVFPAVVLNFPQSA
jgi:hypothetical protein